MNRAFYSPAASTGAKGLVRLAGDLAGTADAPTVPGKVGKGDLFINVGDYVVGNGVADDSAGLTTAVAAAVAAGKTLFAPRHLTVRLASPVDMRYVREIQFEANLVVAYTAGPGVIVGNTSTQRVACNFYFGRVVYGGSQSNVALRVVGLKQGRVTVGYCDYMQIYADAADATISSCAYNEFHLGRVPRLELYGEAGVSWINENNFYGGSFQHLIINSAVGGYAHNANTWHGASCEGSGSTVQILTGNGNRIDGRGEGGCQVTFGSGTIQNVVVDHYSFGSAGGHGTGFVLASDQGQENQLLGFQELHSSAHEVLRVDSRTVMFDASSEYAAPEVPVPGLQRLRLRTFAGQVLETGLVPIDSAATTYGLTHRLKRLAFDSDAAIWRPRVYAYDANRTLIDPTVTPWMSTTTGWTASSTSYSYGVNRSYAPIYITSSAVKYLRVTVNGNTTVGTPFTYFRLLAWVVTPEAPTSVELMRRAIWRPLHQAATPTQGAAQLGQVIGTPTGLLVCVARVDTTLSADAAAGATSITVASAAGISSGDLIGVLQTDDQTHWTTVSGAPAGSTVNLAVALAGAAASGRQVVTNRWVTK